MEILLIVLGFMSLSAAQLLKTTCPSKESIPQCTCKIDISQRPWLSCSGFTSGDQFQLTTTYMKGYSYSSVFIDGSDIGRLPSNAFSGMEIKNIKIAFSNLTALGDGVNRPPFVGLENSLEDLEIRDCFINEASPMPKVSLAHLKKLTLLELANNVIPVIGNDWFQSGPYGLKELYFHTSSTYRLGSHAFAFLVNLKALSVTGGQINELSRTMLPKQANHLTAIDFSYNALTTLPANIFTSMPSLSEVYLDNNAFTVIDELLWSTVWNQLSHVYFFGNPINCSENIKWIYKYRLPEVLGGNCVAPPKLVSKSLSQLTLKDFQ